MSAEIECSECGEVHNIQDSEIGYSLPDDYFQLSEEERDSRGKATSNFCNLDDRYFVRSVIPIPVLEREQNYGWGVWIEISESDFKNVVRTWDDEDVSHIPRFPGRIANAVSQYSYSLGLLGDIELHAEHRPFFYVTEESMFRDDQNNGITEQDVIKYIHRQQ